MSVRAQGKKQLGRVRDDVWHMPAFASPEANLFPEHGYIVVKLPAPKSEERFSVPMVLPDGIGVGGRRHIPCSGSTAPSFTLKAGEVNYVGHISYDFSKEPTSHELSDEANRHIVSGQSRIASHQGSGLHRYETYKGWAQECINRTSNLSTQEQKEAAVRQLLDEIRHGIHNWRVF